MTDPEAISLQEVAHAQPPFARLLGVRVLFASPDRVEAEMDVTQALGNRNGVLHGGAVLGFADNVGGTTSFLNRGPGETTTTLESKSNFFRAVPIGDTIRATCVPLHKGSRTLVLQTTITRGDGKVAAMVTQTQMILKDKQPAS